MVKRFRKWLGTLLAKWARMLLGEVSVASAPSGSGLIETVPPGRDRFEVLRDSHDEKTVLYDGPRGAEAAKRFLQVKSDSQHGVTEFWHTQGGNRVMRDHYQGPE